MCYNFVGFRRVPERVPAVRVPEKVPAVKKHEVWEKLTMKFIFKDLSLFLCLLN